MKESRKRKLSNESLDSNDLDLEDIFFVDQLAKISNKKQKINNSEVKLSVVKDMNMEKLDNPLNYLHSINLEVKGCIHEVIYSTSYQELKPRWKKPALLFPFKLDPFQDQAIQCIENNQSVLVSAHTSAGKTVCANYTIKMCLAAKRRVIYTTPIKALSNQKYRDFLKDFEDVGLMTGDVTINETATVLIMTTEILLIMLYKNSSIMREIGWIIFDEVHYMKDPNRGYVWEESIIYVPRNIRMVFLSATIPNARQFAQWITHIHKQPCNIVYTEYRPTPLRHYLVPSSSYKTYKVVDEKGDFKQNTFHNVMSMIREHDTVVEKKKDETKENFHILLSVLQSDTFPMIVFSFSRKECEDYAMSVKINNLISDKQKKEIDEIWDKSISSLSDDDKIQLPQLDEMHTLLRRGVGIHHSGLLPVLKEIVEILFGKSLLPLLFATDTFAMGLNMPAKAVMFTSLMKFDGSNIRAISGSEYIQMSGRAGRRGLDTFGEVFVLLKETESVDRRIEEDTLKSIIRGQSDALLSSFRLTYSMILNLMRVYAKDSEGEVITPRYLLKRSFKQFQAYSALSDLFRELNNLDSSLDAFKQKNQKIDFCKIGEYVNLQRDIVRIRNNMWANFISKDSKNITQMITRGSLVKLKYSNNDFGWCVALGKPEFSKRYDSKVFPCLVCVDKSSSDIKELSMAKPSEEKTFKYMVKKSKVFHVDWKYVVDVASEKFDYFTFYSGVDTNNLKMSQESLTERLLEKTLNKNVESVDLKKMFGKNKSITKSKNWGNGISKLSKRQRKLAALKVELNNFDGEMALFEELEILENKISSVKCDIESRLAIINCKELEVREKVLSKFGHLETEPNTGDFVVTMKGRVASNVNSGDCLVLTELLFNGHLTGISPEGMAALLSSFVFKGVSNEEDKKRVAMITQSDEKSEIEVLKEKLEFQVQDQARNIAKQSFKLGLLEIGDPDKYAESFNSRLFTPVRAWARGAPFQVISQHKKCGGKTDGPEIPDGHIIRGIRRTAELLLECETAAKDMNCVEMQEQFEVGARKIRRGIVSAASLYVNEDLRELL